MVRTRYNEARTGLYQRKRRASFEEMVKKVFEEGEKTYGKTISLQSVNFENSTAEGDKLLGEFGLALYADNMPEGADERDYRISLKVRFQKVGKDYHMRLENSNAGDKLIEKWDGNIYITDGNPDYKEFIADLEDLMKFCAEYKEDWFEDYYSDYKRMDKSDGPMRESQKRRPSKRHMKEGFEDDFYGPEDFIDESELEEHQKVLSGMHSQTAETLANILGGNEEAKTIIDSILADWTKLDLPDNVAIESLRDRLGLNDEEVAKVRDYFEGEKYAAESEAERAGNCLGYLGCPSNRKSYTDDYDYAMNGDFHRVAESAKRAQEKKALREARRTRSRRFREGYIMNSEKKNPHKNGISQEEQERIDFAKEMFSKFQK